MTSRKSVYQLSDPAFQDLQEIEAYIASDSPAAAEKVINSIEATCDLLAREPQAGRERPELEAGLRSFVSGQYVIFYIRTTDTLVSVVRILHSRRDIDALFT